MQYEREKQKIDKDFYLYLDYENIIDDTYESAGGWLVETPMKKNKFSMFCPVWGDEVYPSFFGMDEKGEVVCLVTDFLITE